MVGVSSVGPCERKKQTLHNPKYTSSRFTAITPPKRGRAGIWQNLDMGKGCRRRPQTWTWDGRTRWAGFLHILDLKKCLTKLKSVQNYINYIKEALFLKKNALGLQINSAALNNVSGIQVEIKTSDDITSDDGN